MKILLTGVAAVVIVGSGLLGAARSHWFHGADAAKQPPSTKPTSAASIHDLTSIHMVNGNQGWAVQTNPETRQSIVLKTSDGGHTWKNVTPPFLTNHSNEIQQYEGLVTDFLDVTHAYVAVATIHTQANGAMADVPTVFVTTDGGKSWSSATTPAPYADNVPVYVHFRTSSNGVEMNEFDTNGGDGFPVHQLYETTDGGLSWHLMAKAPSQTEIPETVKPGQMPTVNPGPGLTWVTMLDQKVGFTPGQNSVASSVPNVALRTKLYKTADGGKTWVPVSLSIPKMNSPASVVILQPSILQSGDIVVPVVENYGVPPTNYQLGLYVSADGGSTFAQVSHTTVIANNAACFGDFLNDNEGWFWIGGNLLMITDGGKTFTKASFPELSTVTSVQFINPTTGYVATDEGLWQTTDGGKRWGQIGR